MKIFFQWWVDNMKRPSTWWGISLFIVFFFIFQDKELMEQLLGNIINNSTFLEMIISAITGGLVAHKNHDTA